MDRGAWSEIWGTAVAKTGQILIAGINWALNADAIATAVARSATALWCFGGGFDIDGELDVLLFDHRLLIDW